MKLQAKALLSTFTITEFKENLKRCTLHPPDSVR
jgi:hypothetical protein